MSSLAGTADQAVRSFAFAEPEANRWGAAWLPPRGPAAAVLALGDEPTRGPVELEGSAPDEPWQLSGPGGELVLEGATEPVWRDPDAPEQGFDQLCRISGTVECLGWRGSLPASLGAKADSLRLITAWFDEAEGFSVLAVRPRKAKGQDEDAIQATLFDGGAPQRVAEPRFSTTYTQAGEPARAGVELWIETEPDSENLYPRRALGQALVVPTEWAVEDLTLEAQPFRWFSGGREGSGVYMLGRW